MSRLEGSLYWIASEQTAMLSVVEAEPTFTATSDPEGRRVVLPHVVWREKIISA
jgi:hypothetical protein